jgi:Type II secretion system (T2SS), protein G
MTLKRYWLGISAVIVALALAMLFVDHVPPQAQTLTSMQVLKRRILRYAKAHDALPVALESTTPIDGFVNRTQDAWKNEILFDSSQFPIVTLRSLGRDGAPGGKDDDADITRSFITRDALGKWSEELIRWETLAATSCCESQPHR